MIPNGTMQVTAPGVSPGYFVMNGQASYHFAQYFTAEIGINNIFDRNYTIQEGYPEAGRNFMLL